MELFIPLRGKVNAIVQLHTRTKSTQGPAKIDENPSIPVKPRAVLAGLRLRRWGKVNEIVRAVTLNGHKFVYLDNPTVELIQRAVIKVIGASLLVSQTPQI